MRLSKKLIIVVTLVVVLIAGSIGGVALAQTSDDGTQTKPLMERVAEKLGIDQQTLEDAFNEARQEMQEEAMDARLADLVEEGTITQEQADQYKTWIETRPDMPFGPGLGPGPGMHRGFRGPCMGFGGWDAPPPIEQPALQ